MHCLVMHICLAMISELQTACSYNWCFIQEPVQFQNTQRPTPGQNAITHSGVEGFRLALITDLKGEVFLHQVNLTEVSTLTIKWDVWC